MPLAGSLDHIILMTHVTKVKLYFVKGLDLIISKCMWSSSPVTDLKLKTLTLTTILAQSRCTYLMNSQYMTKNSAARVFSRMVHSILSVCSIFFLQYVALHSF